MKCIRILRNGQLKRVSDNTARLLVASKSAEFINKTIWRERLQNKIEPVKNKRKKEEKNDSKRSDIRTTKITS